MVTRLSIALAALLTVSGCEADSRAPVSNSNPETMPELAAETAKEHSQAIANEPFVPQQSASSAQSPNPTSSKVGVSCANGEETVFSCKVKNGSDLAVCAGDENVYYRYGKGSPEMTVMGGRFASVAYSGGGEAQIAFTKGRTTYIVFSRVIRTNFEPGEPNQPAISDGVMVMLGDELLTTHICDDPNARPIDYDLAVKVMEREPELFTIGG